MPQELGEIIAIGTWLYDRKVRRTIELRARPAALAASRWIEDEQTCEFIINEEAPVPDTADGLVYYVGATGGGEFRSAAEAIAWANQQPWGPVEWSFLPTQTGLQRSDRTAPERS